MLMRHEGAAGWLVCEPYRERTCSCSAFCRLTDGLVQSVAHLIQLCSCDSTYTTHARHEKIRPVFPAPLFARTAVVGRGYVLIVWTIYDIVADACTQVRPLLPALRFVVYKLNHMSAVETGAII